MRIKNIIMLILGIIVLLVVIVIFSIAKKSDIDISLLDSKFCDIDNDCVITEMGKFDCCSVCFLEAVNKGAELERKKWEKGNCNQEDYQSCEIAECSKIKVNYIAVCTDNKCEMKEKGR